MADPWKKRVELCGGRAVCYLGDCLEILPTLAADSVDAVVTDPPYGLGFMGKDWDCPGGIGDFPMRRTSEANTVNTGVSRQGGRQRSCADFARRQARDARNFQEWNMAWAVEALRVAKPGAHLLAFGGTRTFHRLACAIEDAGWEIRDTVMWVYGSGFPKSLDVSKAIDKAAGAERESKLVPTKCGKTRRDRRMTYATETHAGFRNLSAPATDAARRWEGWGTALKPAWEPVIVARKPLEGTVAENVQRHGTGAMNIDGCRVYVSENDRAAASKSTKGPIWRIPIHAGHNYESVEYHAQGRWPANLIHDGSEEVVGLFLQTEASKAARRGSVQRFDPADEGAKRPKGGNEMRGHDDAGGSAARFFYCAKASTAEREAGLGGMPLQPGGSLKSGDGSWAHEEERGRKPRHEEQIRARNHHPTVKPIALMRYLCRLVTPPGGVILDPFMGSGSTGKAAMLEGFRFLGIEVDAEYLAIARARIAKTPMSLSSDLAKTTPKGKVAFF